MPSQCHGGANGNVNRTDGHGRQTRAAAGRRPRKVGTQGSFPARSTHRAGKGRSAYQAPRPVRTSYSEAGSAKDLAVLGQATAPCSHHSRNPDLREADRGHFLPPAAASWRQKPQTNDGQTIKARPPQPATRPLTCNNLCSPDGI
jgi:hypothetical protein